MDRSEKILCFHLSTWRQRQMQLPKRCGILSHRRQNRFKLSTTFVLNSGLSLKLKYQVSYTCWQEVLHCLLFETSDYRLHSSPIIYKVATFYWIYKNFLYRPRIWIVDTLSQKWHISLTYHTKAFMHLFFIRARVYFQQTSFTLHFNFKHAI
jgi:hypothetical protein